MREIQKGQTILVIDDSPTNLKIIIEVLRPFYDVYPVTSGARAFEYLEKKTPGLILLDVEMPEMDGYEVMSRLKGDPRWASVPVIFLTAQNDREKEELALSMGAADYVLKPFVAPILLHKVHHHMELQTYRKKLEALVDNKTAQLQNAYDAILNILASVTAFRDNETGAHIHRTTAYVRLLVERLMELNHPGYEIDKEQAYNIVKAAKLHDVGKVAVPDTILLKPSRLTDKEFSKIKQHTVVGGKMIDRAMAEVGDSVDFLNTVKEVVLYHHEYWDGTGYPDGLSGEEIPLAARIMSISDVYDAVVSHRPYKTASSHETAIAILQSESGSHFDPLILSLCADQLEQFEDVINEFSDARFEDEYVGL